MSQLLRLGEAAVLVYFALLNAAALAFILAASLAARRRARERVYTDLADVAGSPLAPPVSVLVPVFNAGAGLPASVSRLLRLDYPRFELVVVNDGSTDDTLALLKTAFGLVPDSPEEGGTLKTRPVRAVYRSRSHDNLTVIDKERGGSADALNAALNAAQHPYFCPVGSGQAPAADALLRLVREVLEAPVRLVGVGGAVAAADGRDAGALGLFSAAESARSSLPAAAAFSGVNGLMSLSGALPLYERGVAAAMGGYRADPAGEDVEFVTRLHRHLREAGERGYAVGFVPDPVCWAEAPASLSALSRQRRRRQRSLLEMLGRNSGLLFDPRYGGLGGFVYPYLFLFEGWGVLVEALGYALCAAAALRGSADFVGAFLALTVLGGAALTGAGALLGESARPPAPRRLVVLAVFGVLEGLCHRPLTTGLRLLGAADFFCQGRPTVA